eukprot:gene5204-10418_t
MVRGVPWDELPVIYEKSRTTQDETAHVKEVEIIPEERNFLKDSQSILKRVAFGAVCGSLTGATFGFVDILRDAKALAAKKSVATAKVIRYTYLFGGFFGGYHGIRKTLKIYNPQPAEINLITATFLSIAPLTFFPTLRPLIPYGVMLIALDAINGIDGV